ncbi:glycosyltransferase family 1 protein [uncultured Bacteroides sp.]|uniref:glycosyltransferase family 4 protein n=1 Tax=uncultured Bacteroides sp. TaxID=162156 RepID=UPI0026302C1D|nr:glycosyltransferase family 1 protein [uncultured Bacteroides sp.]
MFVFDLTACQSYGKTIKHGGGEYARIIFEALLARGGSFSCVYSTALFIDSYFLQKCKERRIICKDYKDLGLIPTLKSMNCTTFYSALPYLYGNLNFTGINFIGTIHGLRDLEIQSDSNMYLYESSFQAKCKSLLKETKFYKKISYERNYKRFKSLFENQSFKYIVVSNHTKNAILTFFPEINPTNIQIYYSPNYVEIKEHINSSESFYLLVSGNRWLKNSFRALKAIDNLISKGLIHRKTLVTGSCSKYILNRLKNKHLFTFLPYVSDEELSQLMQKAYCFIYPSLNEGFGYPPLQAMACGTPVIASAVCSIPEVCGLGALYFNPYSVCEIENRLLQIEDNCIRSTLIVEGYKRFEFISKRQTEDLKNLVDFLLK